MAKRLLMAITILFVLLFTRVTAFPFSAVVWRQIDLARSQLLSSGLRMMPDSLFGMMLAPDQTVTLSSADFTYTFSIDSIGRRVSPPPTKVGLPKFVFVGSSWTFGVGVNDAQTFSYRTAQKVAQSFEVWNEGHVRFGFQDSVRRIKQYVENGVLRKNDIIFLEWLPTTAPRLIQPSSSRSRGDFNFEFPDNLDPKEKIRSAHEIVDEMIRSVNEQCHAKGIRFVLLILSKDANDTQMPPGEYEQVKKFVEAASVSYLDVSEVAEDVNPFPHDPHPGSGWHESVSKKIADFVNGQNRA